MANSTPDAHESRSAARTNHKQVYAFGSSTPRYFDYLMRIPLAYRVYDAKLKAKPLDGKLAAFAHESARQIPARLDGIGSHDNSVRPAAPRPLARQRPASPFGLCVRLVHAARIHTPEHAGARVARVRRATHASERRTTPIGHDGHVHRQRQQSAEGHA